MSGGKQTSKSQCFIRGFLPAVASMLVIATGGAFSAFAMETYLTLENDAFLHGGEDNDFTHGTRLESVTDGGWHYLVQQTMYAPDNLEAPHHIPGDRPYAGMLLGAVGYEFSDCRTSPWTHYGELDFGVIGPAALCKETQTAIHKMLGCRKPMGWDDQLHNEVVVNVQWWTKYNWFLQDWIAIVPRVGVAVGTIQDFSEIGCDLKIGWHIRPTAKNDIIFSAPRYQSWTDKFSAYFYAGVAERYYLYNHLLEGSLFGHKDDDLDVDIEHFVSEFKCGVVMRYDRFFAAYYAVFRTDEFKRQKNAPDYGGLCVGWTW